MKLQDLWLFLHVGTPNGKTMWDLSHPTLPSIIVGVILIIIWVVRSMTRGKGAETFVEVTPEHPIRGVALLLVLFSLFVIGAMSMLWAFMHFFLCPLLQGMMMFFAAVAILCGIFLAIAAPFSDTLSQVIINITKNIKIGVKGISVSLIVIGFLALLAVGYLLPY